MKRCILNFCTRKIRQKYPDYSDEQLEIVLYGIEGLYLTFSKIIFIFILALILGIFKKMIMLLIFYNIIRFTAFGMHAKKSWHCLLLSTSMFIGGVYICEFINISIIIKLIIAFICSILILLYAPADTEKRPLINKNKRRKYKIISIINSFIYIIFIIIYKEKIISNYLLIGLIFSTLMILPITYKIFNLPYNNYKRYNTKVV